MFVRQVLYHFNHSLALYCVGYFLDRVSWTICLGWPQTAILQTSAFQVARITVVSQWHPASNFILEALFLVGLELRASSLQSRHLNPTSSPGSVSYFDLHEGTLVPLPSVTVCKTVWGKWHWWAKQSLKYVRKRNQELSLLVLLKMWTVWKRKRARFSLGAESMIK
jgi:hypothetical protein